MAGLGKVKSVAAYGIEAYVLEIEVYITKGLLAFNGGHWTAGCCC